MSTRSGDLDPGVAWYLMQNGMDASEFINITPELEKALATARVQEGLVLASAMHITAGVYINDAEDGLIACNDYTVASAGESLAENHFSKAHRYAQCGDVANAFVELRRHNLAHGGRVRKRLALQNLAGRIE